MSHLNTANTTAAKSEFPVSEEPGLKFAENDSLKKIRKPLMPKFVVKKVKKAKFIRKTKGGPAQSGQLPAPPGFVKCQMCGKVFQTNVQLGGHTSRAHKGLSPSY